MDEPPIEQPTESPQPVATAPPPPAPSGWWRSLDGKSRAAIWVAAGALVVAVAIAAFGISRIHHEDRIGFVRASRAMPYGGPGRMRPRRGFMAMRNMRAEALSAAAKAIGISESDLRDQVMSGTSMADVAKAHHVDPQKVIDAIVSLEKKRIDAAVKDGRIPQPVASRLEAHLEQTVAARVYSSGGPQPMFGPGRMMGGG